MGIFVPMSTKRGDNLQGSAIRPKKGKVKRFVFIATEDGIMQRFVRRKRNSVDHLGQEETGHMKLEKLKALGESLLRCTNTEDNEKGPCTSEEDLYGAQQQGNNGRSALV